MLGKPALGTPDDHQELLQKICWCGASEGRLSGKGGQGQPRLGGF